MRDKVRILLCDDNESVRQTLARALRYKKGIEIVGEVSSFTGLRQVMDGAKPDVILLDVNMPGTSGVDGLRELRGSGDSTPVIVMSANKRNREAALEAGAVGFFYKGTTDLAGLVQNLRDAAAKG